MPVLPQPPVVHYIHDRLVQFSGCHPQARVVWGSTDFSNGQVLPDHEEAYSHCPYYYAHKQVYRTSDKRDACAKDFFFYSDYISCS
jgi:hypothetical protein